jgi:HD-GYP domain-containing protein (c-di-GMP phosphodiesterase class II)
VFKSGFFYKRPERFQTLTVGAVFTIALCLVSIKFPAALERAVNFFYDFQSTLVLPRESSPVPVIIELDEKSLEIYGQWPWPRYLIAKLLDNIVQSGAKAVGVDAFFPEKDRTSPEEIKRVLLRDFKRTLSLENIEEPLWNYDKILADTLASGPFVLAYFFTFDVPKNDSCTLKSASGALITDYQAHYVSSALFEAMRIICSIPLINEAASATGFSNASPDADGIYRKTPMIIERHGRIYPSLALQTFMTASGFDRFLVEAGKWGYTLWVGDITMPLDSRGNLLLRFRGAGRSYDYISAADILSGKVPADRLKDKIVFVGFSATGLHEYRPTAFDPLFTGVEFHAAIVDNLLNRDFLQRPAAMQAIEMSLALVLGLGLSWCFSRTGPIGSALIPGFLIFGIIGISQICLIETGLVISPVLPMIAILFVQLGLSLLKYGREHLRSMQLAGQVMRTQEALIESFCAMSEYRDPETGAHIKRTQNYIKALSLQLRDHPRFIEFLDDNTIELMFNAAPLHDIGKIGIRDYILLKPGSLEKEEFEIMKMHTVIGAQTIEAVAARMGWNKFLTIARDIIYCHHEKWDGSGYPRKLFGDEIPVSARLMALADVYDALISRRVYKPPFSHNIAVKMIAAGKGTHFDPDIVEAFLTIHVKFRGIALSLLDSEIQKDILLAE